MQIGILGSGLMGSKLGTIFTRMGHNVVFSYARRQDKLERLAREAGERARAGTPKEAAESADMLLLAVHWSRVDDVLAQTGPLEGIPLVTCSLPMSDDDSHMILGLTSSGAEVLAEKAPEAHIVSAFSTVPSEVLFPVFNARGSQTPPDLVYCGNNEGAKEIAATIIREVGFNPVDLGDLQAARYIEPFALLSAQIAYDGSANPALAYRFERLTDADS